MSKRIYIGKSLPTNTQTIIPVVHHVLSVTGRSGIRTIYAHLQYLCSPASKIGYMKNFTLIFMCFISFDSCCLCRSHLNCCLLFQMTTADATAPISVSIHRTPCIMDHCRNSSRGRVPHTLPLFCNSLLDKENDHFSKSFTIG